jgi:hypothetical protein
MAPAFVRMRTGTEQLESIIQFSYLDTFGLVKSYFSKFFAKMKLKKKCNAIRYYDPTQLKEAYRIVRAGGELLQTKNTVVYTSSDIDKYFEFRLVHQLYNGGCDSMGRFAAVVDTFLKLLADSHTHLCLKRCKSLCRLMTTLIAFCNSDSISMLVDLETSEIPSQSWVGILKTTSSAAATAAGKFPDMLKALEVSGIDKTDWVGILK